MSNARIISEGTLRTEDLLPVFIDIVSERLEASAMEPGMDQPDPVRLHGDAQTQLGEIERRMQGPGYYDSEQADWDMEIVQGLLDWYAPEGTYFGANEGDGACFGFWDVDDSEVV